MIIWNDRLSIGGTFFRCYLTGRFSEMKRKLENMSGQDSLCDSWGEQTTFMFVGSIGGHTFTIYDYEDDKRLHIGGTDVLDLGALELALKDVGHLDSERTVNGDNK